MNQRPTVSVIIPAYNEESNIGQLIKDCLAQSYSSYELKEVIIISDGSSDDTVSQAQQVIDPRISIQSYSDRAGKALRLNAVYKTIASDIIINLDADVRITDIHVFEHLIKRHVMDGADVVCGISLPLKPTTFIEKAAFLGSSMYVKSKYTFAEKMGKNCIDGRLFSCTTVSIKNIQIPQNTATDTYTYFYFKLHKNSVVFEPRAVVLFRLPTTMRDYIRQHKRYERPNYHLYFDKDFLDKEDTQPAIRWKSMLIKKMFIHPLQTSCLIIMHFYSKYAARHYNRVAVWEHISSSKRV